MIGVFKKELFGHWLPDEEESEEPEQPAKSKVDLRSFLNEPGALKQLVDFMKDVKDVEKKEKAAKKKSQKKKRN
jgi:hypothetical protein